MFLGTCVVSSIFQICNRSHNIHGSGIYTIAKTVPSKTLVVGIIPGDTSRGRLCPTGTKPIMSHTQTTVSVWMFVMDFLVASWKLLWKIYFCCVWWHEWLELCMIWVESRPEYKCILHLFIQAFILLSTWCNTCRNRFRLLFLHQNFGCIKWQSHSQGEIRKQPEGQSTRSESITAVNGYCQIP